MAKHKNFRKERIDLTLRDTTGRKIYKNKGEPSKVFEDFHKKFGRGKLGPKKKQKRKLL